MTMCFAQAAPAALHCIKNDFFTTKHTKLKSISTTNEVMMKVISIHLHIALHYLGSTALGPTTAAAGTHPNSPPMIAPAAYCSTMQITSFTHSSSPSSQWSPLSDGQVDGKWLRGNTLHCCFTPCYHWETCACPSRGKENGREIFGGHGPHFSMAILKGYDCHVSFCLSTHCDWDSLHLSYLYHPIPCGHGRHWGFYCGYLCCGFCGHGLWSGFWSGCGGPSSHWRP
jgi:hypothetical protein